MLSVSPVNDDHCDCDDGEYGESNLCDDDEA